MQKFISIALFSVATIKAQEDPGDKKFSHIVKMVRNQLEGKTSWTEKEISKRLQNYGCHCFPNNARIVGGAGPAMDERDQLCRVLSRCHKCIEQDHGVSSFDAEWDANIGRYRWEEAADGSIDCSQNNEQYKKDLCECDSAFAEALGAMWDDSSFDFSLWDNKNNNLFNFDSENTCVGVGNSADSCCGTYPNRYPFNSNDRTCCAASSTGKTYNAAMEDCCPDGSISSIGSC